MFYMEWLSWLIVGLLAGWLASVVTRVNGPQGFWMYVLAGVAGASIGGVFFSLTRIPAADGINVWSVVSAFIGAVIVMWLMRTLVGRRIPSA
jgi:uncharacterized membrane protein YeaQ/YmgE (transglycosylase-associated protein family)